MVQGGYEDDLEEEDNPKPRGSVEVMPENRFSGRVTDRWLGCSDLLLGAAAGQGNTGGRLGVERRLREVPGPGPEDAGGWVFGRVGSVATRRV